MSKKPANYNEVKAEFKYWRWVVEKYMVRQADWKFIDEAVDGLINGTHNQEYAEDEMEYPIMRCRKLKTIISEMEGTDGNNDIN